jgi:hypothetical protein
MRHIALIAAVVAGVALPAIGINRLVVTDGKIDAQVAFNSETFPLER